MLCHGEILTALCTGLIRGAQGKCLVRWVGACYAVVSYFLLGGFLLLLGGMFATTEGNHENRNDQDLGRDFTAVLLKSVSWFECQITKSRFDTPQEAATSAPSATYWLSVATDRRNAVLQTREGKL